MKSFTEDINEMCSDRKWEIHLYNIKAGVWGYEFYQSSTLLHCVNTRNIADTSALLQININFIFTEYIGGNSIDTIRQDFPPI